MQTKINFASDNYAAVHPAALKAINTAAAQNTPAYGGDTWTQEAEQKLQELFGKNSKAFFVFNGTAANVLALQTITRSYQAIIAAESAHITNDECGAVEKFVGSTIIKLPTPDGKLTPELVAAARQRIGDQHAIQPTVISITQSTEWGTAYSITELKALADYAHQHNMYIHMDGARLYNAAASLGTTLKALTTDIGIDVVSLGGTKNGIFLGEAVVFCNPALAQDFMYIRKQGMQLASKMRLIAAQYSALFSDNLWLTNAQHANKMAQLLAQQLTNLGVPIVQQVQANAVFAQLPAAVIAQMQEKFYFYTWNEAQSIVRLMASWNTTEEEINTFVTALTSTL